MISALRRASAKRVTAVIPYFSYRRNLQRGSRLNEDSHFIYSSAADIARVFYYIIYR